MPPVPLSQGVARGYITLAPSAPGASHGSSCPNVLHANARPDYAVHSQDSVPPGKASREASICALRRTLTPERGRNLSKVHILQVDQRQENIDELEAGIAVGRTVEDWQMPKDSKPSDLVVWYAAGQQKYIALGWVDAIPLEVTEGPGPYRGTVARMTWIEPSVDRKKVIADCGIDGGVQSYQTIDDQSVPGFLESLGLPHLTASMRLQQLCPRCHQLKSLTGVCGNCD